MGITSILNVAQNALFAQQTAMQVVSNNVANASTDGYMREEAVFNEAPSVQTDFGMMGNGVSIEKVMAQYDKYLESSLSKENAATEEQKTYEQYFSRLESILSDSNTNLTSNITSFFNSWQSLSTDPLNTTSRTNVAMQGTNMCSSIRNVYSELKSIQAEANSNVAQQVTSINGILHSLAEVNTKMYEEGAGGKDDASLISQRTKLIKDLSGIMNIQSFEDKDGGMSVMTSNGKILVDRGNVNELSAQASGASGFYSVVWNSGSGVSIDITNNIQGGSLKSYIDLRDNQIAGFIGTINDLAQSLMTEVNNIHSTGYTANGTTGINFFKNLTSDYACNIDISDEVKTDVGNIAATSSTSNTSGNDIALALANLGSASVTISGQNTTYTDYAASIGSTVGNLSKNAQDLYQYHQNILSAVQSQRDSLSGVSINEEMTNLIKFQYAYQAAARLLNTADSLFSTLLAIGGNTAA
ncbi:MAG TPA: flagellar hook-associated protein FlgK [Syntrophorhabdaceae bacterium]|nr:flagellar hook-associated protein FlgK [Syntrophorhabdaceae bacterium]